MRVTLLLCALVLAAAPVLADTIVVDVDGTGDFTQIKPAVDASSVGDTVLVLPGFYSGEGNRSIDFEGKDIVLRSRDGRESTVIDPYSAFYAVFNFDSGETRAAVLEGFTIQGAVQNALICDGASPTIRACRFCYCQTNNWSQMHTRNCAVGGAKYSSILIEDCLFDHNTAEGAVSTIFVYYCSGATIRGCTFSQNVEVNGSLYDDPSGVITFWDSVNTQIENCRFVNNEERSSCVSVAGNSGASIVDCTFEGNSATSSSPEGIIHVSTSSFAVVLGCTFSGNPSLDSCVSVDGPHYCRIDGCTFVDNGHSQSGDANAVIRIGPASAWDVILTNSVFAFNECPVPIACEVPLAAISSCCFAETGDPGGTCEPYDPETLVFADPLFCDREGGDYSLCANSPCLPGNNPWGVTIGAYGEGCASCDSPVEATSWGAIKAMFR